MRKFKDRYTYSDDLKTAPLGTCKVCGGEGRYKTTHKHKQPVIHKCIYCNATGKVDITVEAVKGRSFGEPRWYLISDNGDSYTVTDRKGELVQLDKKEYKIVG